MKTFVSFNLEYHPLHKTFPGHDSQKVPLIPHLTLYYQSKSQWKMLNSTNLPWHLKMSLTCNKHLVSLLKWKNSRVVMEGKSKINSNSLPQQIWANNVRILLLPSTNFQVYGQSYLTYTRWTAHSHGRICYVIRLSEVPAAGRFYFGILNTHTEGISTTTEKPKPEINTFCLKPGKAQIGK